jgi:carbon starvation protein CstA
MLKYIYSLSEWFGRKRKDRILSGTSFLYTMVINHLLASIILFILAYYSINVNNKYLFIIVLSVLLLITFTQRKRIEKYIQRRKLKQEYRNLTRSQVLIRRCIGLSLLIGSFCSMFVVAIIYYND